MNVLETLEDVRREVRDALAGCEGTYDIDAIAHEISNYRPEQRAFEIVRNGDAFWETVLSHEIA